MSRKGILAGCLLTVSLLWGAASASAQTASIQGFGQSVNGNPGTVFIQAGDQLRVSPSIRIGNANNNNTVVLSFTATWIKDPGGTISTANWDVYLNPNTPPFDYTCTSLQPVLGNTEQWYGYDLQITCNNQTLDWRGCRFDRSSGGGGGGGGGGGID